MERTCDYIRTKVDDKGREYYNVTFIVPSTNIHVMDELRKRLRNYNDFYNFGSHTGCLYDVKNHHVFFTVGIPVGETFLNDWEFDVCDIFDDVESKIDELERRIG
jgi:hypothetical protein